ncbi:MAG: DUF736 domain-containing protein [Rhodospirillales bacterium]|nr:DUF736 domain-containing protein [Rhodospirillales bacterium]
MSKIGYLNEPNAQGEFQGEIKTLQYQIKIRFIPNPQKFSLDAPDFLIMAQGDIEIGSAWKKTKQKIGDIMIEFFSITIDDPGMPHPLNVAAFKKEDGGYDITWRRRQASQKPQNEAA